MDSFRKLSPISFSALLGDDNQKEDYWPLGALPLFSRWGGDRFRPGLLSLRPTAGAKGGLQLRAHVRGALSGCQSNRRATQGNLCSVCVTVGKAVFLNVRWSCAAALKRGLLVGWWMINMAWCFERLRVHGHVGQEVLCLDHQLHKNKQKTKNHQKTLGKGELLILVGERLALPGWHFYSHKWGPATKFCSDPFCVKLLLQILLSSVD